MIISISGKKNSGKDLVGSIIQYLTSTDKNRYNNFEEWNIYHQPLILGSNWRVKKFADKLKDIVCLLINCTREQLEDEEFKNTELGKEWWKWKINNLGDKDYFSTEQEAIIYNNEIYKGTGSISCIKPTPRFLLQNIGTDLFRNQLHPDIWINSLMNDYNPVHTKEMCSNPKDYKNCYPNWVITDLRFPNELKAIKDKGSISIRINRKEQSLDDYRQHLEDTLEEGIYDMSTDDFKCHTGKAGYIEFLVSLEEEFRNQSHISETALDNAEFDYVIENNGSIEELIEKVRKILIKEKII